MADVCVMHAKCSRSVSAFSGFFLKHQVAAGAVKNICLMPSRVRMDSIEVDGYTIRPAIKLHPMFLQKIASAINLKQEWKMYSIPDTARYGICVFQTSIIPCHWQSWIRQMDSYWIITPVTAGRQGVTPSQLNKETVLPGKIFSAGVQELQEQHQLSGDSFSSLGVWVRRLNLQVSGAGRGRMSDLCLFGPVHLHLLTFLVGASLAQKCFICEFQWLSSHPLPPYLYDIMSHPPTPTHTFVTSSLGSGRGYIDTEDSRNEMLLIWVPYSQV